MNMSTACHGYKVDIEILKKKVFFYQYCNFKFEAVVYFPAVPRHVQRQMRDKCRVKYSPSKWSEARPGGLIMV